MNLCEMPSGIMSGVKKTLGLGAHLLVGVGGGYQMPSHGFLPLALGSRTCLSSPHHLLGLSFAYLLCHIQGL